MSKEIILKMMPEEVDIFTKGEYINLPMETIREIEGKNKALQDTATKLSERVATVGEITKTIVDYLVRTQKERMFKEVIRARKLGRNTKVSESLATALHDTYILLRK